MTAPPPTSPRARRRSRRRLEASGHLAVAWRQKGPMWVLKYRLPDGTESKATLGLAWVVRVPDRAEGYRARRGRPPEGWIGEDDARRRLRDFLDEQSRVTPAERVTFERCLDAFLELCEEKRRSPTTMRTYRQIGRELRGRWGADADAAPPGGWASPT